MKLPPEIQLWGNTSFRGECPQEYVELSSFFSRIRREYPDSYGAVATHIRNEQKREKAQFSSIMKHSAEGMVKGAVDILIPARVPFCCEMKRQNPQLSAVSKEQIKYLQACHNLGSFAVVALGAKAAWEAFTWWVSTYQKEG